MKYFYIRAWGKLLGSFPYYIENQVEQAKTDKAPETATYKKQDGTWATFEEIENHKAKSEIMAIVERMKENGK